MVIAFSAQEYVNVGLKKRREELSRKKGDGKERQSSGKKRPPQDSMKRVKVVNGLWPA